MRIERHYTKGSDSAYASIAFDTTKSEIRNPDGSVVFLADEIEVPAGWSQVAADVLAQKYFRKAGVPARLKRVEENDVPSFLWRSVPDEAALEALPAAERYVSETSARQVFDRLAGAWAYWGWKGGYFDSEDDARAYYDEMRFMLARQLAAPNSPQWFNTGLHWAYGIDGPGQGHYYVDWQTGELTPSKSAYEHPQPHACFIQSVADDLVNEGGIMDLWVREARLFKYGSGTGTNFSALRGENEKLSGGGRSSGLMSFLKIGDRAAGAIKSGGTTRRAAKMVIVDVDHPDIEAFIDWKVKEEQKVAALVTGSKIVKRHLKAIMKACVNCEGPGDDCFNPDKNPALKREVKLARRDEVPDGMIRRIIQFARQGFRDVAFDAYDTDWDSEAYLTVAGQNSNNSVRVNDAFLHAVEADGDWNLTRRLDGKIHKTLKARELWDEIAYAAWASADPGLQYHTTINDWHTCPASGPIRASNPCSEYMFLDDTACNLASLNLLQFRDPATKAFDVAAYEHAVRLWTLTLEISVMMAQFPSREIARNSYDYRTLGLGFANIGGLLMSSGIGYDSDEGRAICGALSAIMTGRAYATSAEIAAKSGAFPGYAPNAEPMLRVIRNHARAAEGQADGYEELSVAPTPLDHASIARAGRAWAGLSEAARASWRDALELGQQHGYRNAQVSVVAPTGTIGLVMDCDTTGIEPDFALVKFKKLAGGGYFKIINRAVPEALRALGYGEAAIAEIEAYATGHGSLGQSPGVNISALRAKGLTDAVIAKLERALAIRVRHQIRLQQVDARRGFPDGDAEDSRRKARGAGFRPAQLARLQQSRDRGRQHPHLRGDDAGRRAAPEARALQRVRLRQSVRAHRQALPLGREPHPHDGGGAAVHLRGDLQDDQHAQRCDRRGLQGRLHAVLASRAEGQRALSRRLETLAAAELAADRERRRGGRRGRDAGGVERAGARGGGRGADRRARGGAGRAGARARETAEPAQELHPEGGRRRPQGLSAHRRIRGRAARRNLHRHAQGRRRLPLADEQFRDRDFARAAVWRAVGGICRSLHLHPLRARRLRAGQRCDQERDLDPRLHLPRTRDLLSRPPRPRPCRARRDRQYRARRRRRPGQGPRRRRQPLGGFARPRALEDGQADGRAGGHARGGVGGVYGLGGSGAHGGYVQGATALKGEFARGAREMAGVAFAPAHGEGRGASAPRRG